MIPLRAQFGDIDIYLFDQLLRGRITPGLRVVDAGCGAGRNLVYLLQSGYEVFAVDADARAVDTVRALAARLAPSSPNDSDHFRVEPLEATTFPSGFADVAISSAVLHFARDDEHFDAMLDGTWRLVARGGFMFCRLASSIGLVGGIRLTGPAKGGHLVLQQPDVSASGRGRYLLPDGSERYLVDEATLIQKAAELGGVLLDPIKTTVVQNQRCMTTWVVRKA
jgi:tellurite methyltransferase